MSKSIALYIPQNVVEPQNIISILKGRIGVEVKTRLADEHLFWIDVLTKQEKSITFSFHFSSGTLPNHIALLGTNSPELEHIFRLIREVTGGTLQVYEDDREVIEHPEKEMWSNQDGLPYAIKRAMMFGAMKDSGDLVGLLEFLASEDKYYSPSDPIGKVMQMFKKEPELEIPEGEAWDRFIASRKRMNKIDYFRENRMDGIEDVHHLDIVATYEGYYIDIIRAGTKFVTNFDNISKEFDSLAEAEVFFWNNYVESDGFFNISLEDRLHQEALDWMSENGFPPVSLDELLADRSVKMSKDQRDEGEIILKKFNNL